MPLDVVWSDLDYMQDRQIFSVDGERFTAKHYDAIQNRYGVHYVPLLDVGVGVKYGKKDKAYREGINMDVFLRSPTTGQRLRGAVWPGPSYYPDFFHPNISLYWSAMLAHLHRHSNFSGIWADMNDPTNFCHGECDWPILNDTDANTTYLHDPIHFPYLPGSQSLELMTLSMNAKHYHGHLHKDVHNLYGFQHCYHTHQAIHKLGKALPFVLTRSTFPGSGKYCAHWTGDNAAKWDFLYLSIGQILLFNV